MNQIVRHSSTRDRLNILGKVRLGTLGSPFVQRSAVTSISGTPTARSSTHRVRPYATLAESGSRVSFVFTGLILVGIGVTAYGL